MEQLSKKENLFDSVVNILDEARAGVVRATNTNMVIAYWLIGREIVIKLQDEEKRAEYGKKIIEELSIKLNERYKTGFSIPSLRAFRKFYLVYSNNIILNQENISLNDTSNNTLKIGYASRTLFKIKEKSDDLPIFSPHLTWTHYRALMRVENENARNFYEQETVECGWKVKELLFYLP